MSLQIGVLTVGTQPVQIPVLVGINQGVRVLGRAASAGNVFIGTTNSVTTTTGNLLPAGDPGIDNPYTVPPTYIQGGGQLWLVASTGGQVVDWSAA